MSVLRKTESFAEGIESIPQSPHYGGAEEDDEGSEDGDAYDIREEIRAAKTVLNEDITDPIVPDEYLTVEKLVADQKKTAVRGIVESGEGLKNAMLRAYRNYRKESRSNTRNEKKGPKVIDAMALLPPGYKPPSKKPKEPTKPKPPTWGQRPSKPAGRPNHAITDNVSSHQLNEESTLLGPILVDMTPVHVDDMTNKDEIQRKYQETQDQMNALWSKVRSSAQKIYL